MARKKQNTNDKVENPVEENGAMLDFNDYAEGEMDAMGLIDFTEVPDQTLVPDGIYPVTVAKAKAKLSKKGFPMISLELDVELPSGETQKVWDNLSLKEGRARQITKRNLIALGMEPDAKLNPMQIGEALVGNAATAQIVTRPATEQYEASNGVKKYSAVKASVSSLI